MATNHHIAWVYILTNKAMTTLYTGYTIDLRTRLWEHRTKQNPSAFTAAYDINILVYYKGFHSIESAEAMEKQIKGKNKRWKIRLINSLNPEWKDLTPEAEAL
jgi:putative endonuclease